MGFFFAQMLPSLGEWATLMNCGACREADKRDDVGRYGRRPDAGIDLEAVCTGIGAAIRTMHSDLLREEVPDRIAELLRRLDQQEGVGSAPHS